MLGCNWMHSRRFATFATFAAMALFGWLSPASAAGQPPAPGVLLYASFDADAFEYENMAPATGNRPRPGRAGHYPRADYAAGDPVPANTLGVRHDPEGRFGGAARMEGNRRGGLGFDALGNILARRGTVAFWIRFDEMVPRIRNIPFIVFELQRPSAHDHLIHWRAYWDRRHGERFQARYGFGRGRGHNPFAVWQPEPKPAPGEWQHVAFVWDAAVGRRTYWNGALVDERQWSAGRWPNTEHRFPALDQIILGANAGPRSWIGNPVGQSFDELWVFDYPLECEQVASLVEENRPPSERAPVSDETAEARRTWWREELNLDCESVPVVGAGALEARQAFVERALAVKSNTRMPLDGKAHNVWPLQYHGYTADGVDYPLALRFAGEAEFDYVRVRGSLRGALRAGGRTVLELPGSPFVQRLRLDEPASAGEAEVWRESGLLTEIEFYRLARHGEGEFQEPEGGWRFAFSPAEGLERLGEAGRRIAGYYPHDEREALLAGPDAPEGAFDVEAWTPYHVVTEPLDEDSGVGKILLDLALEGFDGPAAFAVRLYDPTTHLRVPWEFDARLPEGAGARRARVLWDGTGLLVEEGRRLWLTLVFDRPGRLLLGAGRSALALYPATDQERGQYIAEQERLLCNYFELMSEPRPWTAPGGYPRTQFKGVGEIMDMCEHILHFAPDNFTAASVYSWILRFAPRWMPEARARYADADPLADITGEVEDAPEGAPDWAVYGREALKWLRPHVDWWVHERQAPNGEFGSYYGDDTCLVNDWVNLALINDPGGHLTESMKKLADFCWENTLFDGVARRVRDHFHTYEEGTKLQPSVVMMDYGNPEYVERLMAISRFYDGHLTAINPRGDRLFRAYYFSALSVATDPPTGPATRAFDTGECLMFQPGCFLVWYNGNPGVLRVLQEWMDGWLARSAGEPAENYFGPAADFATGEPTQSRDRYATRGPAGMFAHLYFLYRITGEERYLAPVVKNFRAGIRTRGSTFGSWAHWRRVAPPDQETDEAVRQYFENIGLRGAFRCHLIYSAWSVTGNRQLLINGLKDTIEHMRKYLPMHTWVGQSADRVWIPQTLMSSMFLGGSACRAKRQYFHNHAVSWEGADDDVARFVVDHGPRHVKALVYSFHDEPQYIAMRVWALEHGRYRVRVGVDTAGDESIGEVKKDAERRLFRYEPIRFSAPPGQVVVVEIEQLDQYEPIQNFPDLAVGEARIVDHGPILSGSHLAVTVHNIGGADAPPATVRLLRDGEVLQERAMPALSAPLDLHPRRHVVRFPGIGEKGGLTVEVLPEGDAMEITRANNVRALD